MNGRKFQVGDRARIAPAKIPRYYPDWLRPGRVVTIALIEGAVHGGHCRYWIRGNRRRPDAKLCFLAQDLRPIGQPSIAGGTRKGAGRPPRRSQGGMVDRSTSEAKLAYIEAHGERLHNGCVIWMGTCNQQGYGITTFQGKTQNVHRVVYILLNGSLLPGELVRHLCDTPACFTPTHLIKGSHADNMRDMRLKWQRKVTYAQENSHQIERG